MPIYAGGLYNAPWTACKSLSRKKLNYFIDIFKDVKNKIEFGDVFCNSIRLFDSNKTNIDCYIASYDYSKTNIDIFYYQNNLEKLINAANKILSRETKYNNFKFDIIGTWTVGHVIIMEKK